jgi:hypothetical protein
MEDRNLTLLGAANHLALFDAVRRSGKVANTALEVVRYLFLLQDFPDNVLCASSAVDAVLRELVLDTRGYAEVCGLIGKFCHYYPERVRDSTEVKRARYERTLQSYHGKFGMPSPEFWPNEYGAKRKRLESSAEYKVFRDPCVEDPPIKLVIFYGVDDEFFTVEVGGGVTVQDVKFKISETLVHLSVSEQCLKSDQMVVLENDKTIDSYGIENLSDLFLSVVEKPKKKK